MSKMTILNVTDWARFVEATNAKLRKNFKAFEIETKDIKDMVSRKQQSYIFGCVYTDYICSDEYRKNRRNASRLDVRKSFADGFYIKIAKRLEDLVEQRKAETKKATGTDLVVLNAENLENAFNEDFNTTLKTGRARRPRNFDPASFVAGTKKGKEFRILDEVTNGNN